MRSATARPLLLTLLAVVLTGCAPQSDTIVLLAGVAAVAEELTVRLGAIDGLLTIPMLLGGLMLVLVTAAGLMALRRRDRRATGAAGTAPASVAASWSTRADTIGDRPADFPLPPLVGASAHAPSTPHATGAEPLAPDGDDVDAAATDDAWDAPAPADDDAWDTPAPAPVPGGSGEDAWDASAPGDEDAWTGPASDAATGGAGDEAPAPHADGDDGSGTPGPRDDDGDAVDAPLYAPGTQPHERHNAADVPDDDVPTRPWWAKREDDDAVAAAAPASASPASPAPAFAPADPLDDDPLDDDEDDEDDSGRAWWGDGSDAADDEVDSGLLTDTSPSVAWDAEADTSRDTGDRT